VGMVDISGKFEVEREARARGVIRLRRRTLNAIKAGEVEKGDIAEAAKIAAIMAVKNTPLLLPYCHTLPVTGVDVNVQTVRDGVEVEVQVKAVARTGVEMEALCGVSAALLCVWDMVKALEKDESGQYPHTEIRTVRVAEKHKGGAPEHHREKRRFVVGYVTVSSSRRQGDDPAGDVAERLIKNAEHSIRRYWVSDDTEQIKRVVERAVDECDAVVVSGGTGVAPEDVTPDALRQLFEKEAWGFGMLFCLASAQQVGSASALSRSTAGVVKGKPVFCIPGSVGAVRTALSRIVLAELDHWIKQARG